MLKNSTVLVSGIFNILHPGHMRLLKFAKKSGKKLTVVIEGDKLAGNDAHIPESLRLEAVQSHNLVNDAFISDDPIEIIINRIQPDIVVKGKEHELLENPELDAVQSYGGRLLFSSGETFFSSVDLIKKDTFVEGSKILAIHTGGIQGVAGFNQILIKKNQEVIHI